MVFYERQKLGSSGRKKEKENVSLELLIDYNKTIFLNNANSNEAPFYLCSSDLKTVTLFNCNNRLDILPQRDFKFTHLRRSFAVPCGRKATTHSNLRRLIPPCLACILLSGRDK